MTDLARFFALAIEPAGRRPDRPRHWSSPYKWLEWWAYRGCAATAASGRVVIHLALCDEPLSEAPVFTILPTHLSLAEARRFQKQLNDAIEAAGSTGIAGAFVDRMSGKAEEHDR